MVKPAVYNKELPVGTDISYTYVLPAAEGDLTGRVYSVKVQVKSGKTLIKAFTTSLNTSLRTLTITMTDTDSSAFSAYLNTPCYWICYYTDSGGLIYPVWIGDVTFKDFRTVT